MTQPETHELNRVMAEICGKEIKEHVEGDILSPPTKQGWVYLVWRNDNGERWDWWDPCTDHNQMALVKAKLREMGVGYDITWNGVRVYAYVYKIYCYHQRASANHESELIAFALAVQAWWKGRGKRWILIIG